MENEELHQLRIAMDTRLENLVTVAEFREFRDRYIDGHTDIKARLASIDASLAAITPIITAHEERFKLMELKCQDFSKETKEVRARTDRIEKSLLGVMVLALTGVLAYVSSGIASHIFPKVT